MLSQWLWIMVCYADPVAVNHGLLYCAKGFESWWVMLSKWLWTMLCYAELGGCESWCVMLSQWLWIMVCYSEPVVVTHSVLWYLPVVVNHGVLCWAFGVDHSVVCWASDCESCCVMLSQWLCIGMATSTRLTVFRVLARTSDYRIPKAVFGYSENLFLWK